MLKQLQILTGMGIMIISSQFNCSLSNERKQMNFELYVYGPEQIQTFYCTNSLNFFQHVQPQLY